MSLERQNNRVVKIYTVVFVVLIIRLVFRHLLGVNEADVLPVARQFFSSRWIPDDWYLNQNIGYRILFNIFAGLLTNIFPFPAAGIIGRITVVILWTYVLTYFIIDLKISHFFIIPLLWLITKYQSIIAGEWIINALETKTFSYMALFAALILFHRKRYDLSGLFLGLSVSFHVLVGGYGSICFAVLMLIDRRTCQITKYDLIRVSFIYLAAASFGLYAVFQNIFVPSGTDKIRAGLIYVYSRVPHHVLPSYWSQRSDLWKPVLRFLMSLAVLVPAALRPWNRFVRIFSRFALISLVFAAAGFILYFSGHHELLKFYPFRLPDSLLMVTAEFLFFSFISRRNVPAGIKSGGIVKRVAGIIVSIIILFGIGISFLNSVDRFLGDPEYFLSYRNKRSSERIVYEWIYHNTPHRSVFMIPPSEKHFFLTAQRAQFVDFKHSPQDEKDILEWYHRLVLLSGDIDDGLGYKLDMDKVNKNYMNLTKTQIEKILKRYKIDYYIGRDRQDLPYSKEFSAGGLAVYDLNPGVKNE